MKPSHHRVQISAHPHLEKDATNNSIVNRNKTAYELRKQFKAKSAKRELEICDMKHKIEYLLRELEEIKEKLNA
jgi:hypothetical protein